jgi:hypothetical protein
MTVASIQIQYWTEVISDSEVCSVSSFMQHAQEYKQAYRQNVRSQLLTLRLSVRIFLIVSIEQGAFSLITS